MAEPKHIPQPPRDPRPEGRARGRAPERGVTPTFEVPDVAAVRCGAEIAGEPGRPRRIAASSPAAVPDELVLVLVRAYLAALEPSEPVT
jgi:hypothetical protein